MCVQLLDLCVSICKKNCMRVKFIIKLFRILLNCVYLQSYVCFAEEQFVNTYLFHNVFCNSVTILYIYLIIVVHTINKMFDGVSEGLCV